MEGMATEQGYIHGSRSDFDFHSTFTVEEAVGVPVFTGVPYTLNGDLTFNKSEGLIFHDVQLRDAGNGTGTLSGIVDLNNFEPTTDRKSTRLNSSDVAISYAVFCLKK